MHFEFTEYQKTVADAIASLASKFRSLPVNHEVYLYSAALDKELERSGFFDIASEPDLGGVMAVHLVIEVAKLPYCSEVMASTLIHGKVRPNLPRPIALATPRRPTRFAPIAKTALIDSKNGLRAVPLDQVHIEPVTTLFSYPFGQIPEDAIEKGICIEKATGDKLRVWHRIGLAAEICGAMHSALAVTIDHVTQRKQFNRAIGANQAVQHRLAEVATHIEAIRWLTYQAASTGDELDASLAALYAQDAVAKSVYDLHQFSGAMGLTLEHPLHFWTYRLRALVSEMGGPALQAEAVASQAWGKIGASPCN